jgi:hypothetical protein
MEDAEMVLKLMKEINDGFSGIYDHVNQGFKELRQEMSKDSQDTAGQRRICNERFMTLETFKTKMETRREIRKQRWDKRLALEVTLVSVVGAFAIEKIAKWLGIG